MEGKAVATTKTTLTHKWADVFHLDNGCLVFKIEARAEPYENGRGFSLRVLRAGAPSKLPASP
jgi:hypothetical protein